MAIAAMSWTTSSISRLDFFRLATLSPASPASDAALSDMREVSATRLPIEAVALEISPTARASSSVCVFASPAMLASEVVCPRTSSMSWILSDTCDCSVAAMSTTSRSAEAMSASVRARVPEKSGSADGADSTGDGSVAAEGGASFFSKLLSGTSFSRGRRRTMFLLRACREQDI